MNSFINLLLTLIYIFLCDKDEDTKKDTAIEAKEILIEKHNEGFYAWLKEGNTFVGQANTPEGLFELIRSKFPKQHVKLIRSEQQ